MKLLLKTALVIIFICSFQAKYSHGLDLSNNNPESNEGKILIHLPVRINISGLDDFESDCKVGDGAIRHDDKLCIYTNSDIGYRIIAESQNGNGKFRLNNNSLKRKIAYVVKWRDSISRRFTNLTEGAQSTIFNTDAKDL